ncbi:uncharacterized protein LOC131266142 [Anopheles coustani]|uniref:uncharacterized protein LOC131266142 n=1 Tax=Anopheles coustani TaxID=139045 RepID=UPI002658F799|nr:uncharacterized protein LOC131266142 [Anopheles coustani]
MYKDSFAKKPNRVFRCQIDMRIDLLVSRLAEETSETIGFMAGTKSPILLEFCVGTSSGSTHTHDRSRSVRYLTTEPSGNIQATKRNERTHSQSKRKTRYPPYCEFGDKAIKLIQLVNLAVLRVGGSTMQ